MEALLRSPHLVDAIALMTLIEGAVLYALHHLRRLGPPPRDWLPNIVSGVLLMLSLRSVLAQSAWWWIAGFLLAAGIVHWMDLISRWRAPLTPPR
ncbi:hypothetical protein IP84_04790 [beta proteobacterium AAP99]|nr:hypothetical protein IP84_04790 [beta proteobacterium AAP99]